MPPAVSLGRRALHMRLASAEQDSLTRLRHYLQVLRTAPAQFDTLRLAALGFACTGTSYLVDPAEEAAVVAEVAHALQAPVVTGAAALRAGVAALGARRIALLCPYPEALCAALRAWWERAGVEVVALQRLATATADTRGIYALTTAAAAATARGLAGFARGCGGHQWHGLAQPVVAGRSHGHCRSARGVVEPLPGVGDAAPGRPARLGRCRAAASGGVA